MRGFFCPPFPGGKGRSDDTVLPQPAMAKPRSLASSAAIGVFRASFTHAPAGSVLDQRRTTRADEVEGPRGCVRPGCGRPRRPRADTWAAQRASFIKKRPISAKNVLVWYLKNRSGRGNTGSACTNTMAIQVTCSRARQEARSTPKGMQFALSCPYFHCTRGERPPPKNQNQKT